MTLTPGKLCYACFVRSDWLNIKNSKRLKRVTWSETFNQSAIGRYFSILIMTWHKFTLLIFKQQFPTNQNTFNKHCVIFAGLRLKSRCLNKFYSRITIPVGNKALWLAVDSHVTSFNQSECICSQLSCHTTLKFVDGISSSCAYVKDFWSVLTTEWVSECTYIFHAMHYF